MLYSNSKESDCELWSFRKSSISRDYLRREVIKQKVNLK